MQQLPGSKAALTKAGVYDKYPRKVFMDTLDQWAVKYPSTLGYQEYDAVVSRAMGDLVTGVPDVAARIHKAANFFQIYWQVILPNIIPAQITLAIMKFLWAWSAFFWPLILINSKQSMVLPVAIATLFTESQTFWGQIFAAATVSVVPVILLFILLQRYYIQGVAQTGLK